MAQCGLLYSYDLIKKCQFPWKMTWIISKYDITWPLEIHIFLYLFFNINYTLKSYFDNLTPWIAFLMSFVLYYVYCYIVIYTVLCVLQYYHLYCIMCTAVLCCNWLCVLHYYLILPCGQMRYCTPFANGCENLRRELLLNRLADFLQIL